MVASSPDSIPKKRNNPQAMDQPGISAMTQEFRLDLWRAWGLYSVDRFYAAEGNAEESNTC